MPQQPCYHDSRHGISACRKRIRLSRALKKSGAPSIAQTANRESPPASAEIDRRAPSRARFDVEEEADAA